MNVSFTYKFDNVNQDLDVNLYHVKHIIINKDEVIINERDDYHYAIYVKTRIMSDIDIEEV